MGEGETRDYSKAAILDRFRSARKTREKEIIWLAWLLDAAALMLLIALGWMIASVLVFVGARFASKVPTPIGWGYMAALFAFIAVPMLFVLFTSP